MRLILSLIAFASAEVEEEVSGERFSALKKDGAVFVKFYAPWCGHCKKMAPAWSELAEEINSDDEWEANILSVDCTQHKSVCAENGVSGYPTVKLFYPDVDEGIKYAGARTKDALADWLDDKLTEKYGDAAGDEEGDAPIVPKGEILVLDDATFAQAIAPPAQITMVKFYAPWCGHCKKMAPAWTDLAKLFGDDEAVVIADVDCTVQAAVCSANGVKGYPTIKTFKGGEEIEKYSGARDINGFKAAIAKYKGTADKPVVVEKAKEAAKPAVVAEPVVAEPAVVEGPHAPELTGDNFAETIATGSWMVKFYAPWCGHCKSMAAAWEDLAKARKTTQPKVGIASVDCTVSNPICKENEVKGFPTVLFFQDGKNMGKHQGGRDLSSLQKSIGKFVNPEAAAAEDKKASGTVDAFNAKIKGKQAFVKFYAPWCGHCKKLAPAWGELEELFKDNEAAVVVKVDCTAEEGKEICTAGGIRGYPTLQHFDGTQVVGAGTKYTGGRDINTMTTFMESKLPAAAAVEEKDEL